MDHTSALLIDDGDHLENDDSFYDSDADYRRAVDHERVQEERAAELQQSFIFGPARPSSRGFSVNDVGNTGYNDDTEDDTYRRRGLSTTTGYQGGSLGGPSVGEEKGKQDEPSSDETAETRLVTSYTIGRQMLEYRDVSSPQALVTTTVWKRVVSHLFLSILLLPLYAIALVTHTWKMAPRMLTRTKGVAVMGVGALFYALLWAQVGLYVNYSEVREYITVEDLLFALLLYALCCFAESLLKNTTVLPDPELRNVYHQLAHIYVTCQESASESPRSATPSSSSSSLAPSVAPSPMTWYSLADLVERFRRENATTYESRARKVVRGAMVLSTVYMLVVAGIYVAFILQSEPPGSVKGTAVVTVYIVINELVQWALASVIFYQLGQAVLRLSDREAESICFKALTSYTRSNARGLPYLRLDTLHNLQGWQVLRSTLLKEYEYPTLHVDVILSASFVLWVPLALVAVVDFLFRGIITQFAAFSAVFSLLVLGYLVVCVTVASRVRENFSSFAMLRAQEMHLLYPTVLNPSTEGTDDTENTRQRHLTQQLLPTVAKAIERNKEDAVVFRVWGMPLNRRMATFMGGIMATVASSLVARLSAGMSAV